MNMISNVKDFGEMKMKRTVDFGNGVKLYLSISIGMVLLFLIGLIPPIRDIMGNVWLKIFVYLFSTIIASIVVTFLFAMEEVQ